jgi:ATP-binding cassette subfamily F protein 3
LGRNGAGKSTFIKLLSGELTAQDGIITRNKNLTVGYFAQHTLDKLNGEKSALEHMQKVAKTELVLNLRKFLGGFAFSGDMVLMPVKNFSGGEKARLALALIVWQAPSILLLDEPTNHLDIDMRQALILALQNYDGAVIIVSHDRFLLSQVVDDYWLISDKKIQPFGGGIKGYKKWLLNNKFTADKGKPKKAKENKSRSMETDHIKTLEKKISSLQKEISTIDSELIELSADARKNATKIKNLQIKRTQIMKKNQTCEEEWLHNAETLNT